MTLFGYDQGVFGTPGTAETSSFLTGYWMANRDILGGVIVTPDFLDTLKLNGPENTSLVGTVTALCRYRLVKSPFLNSNCFLDDVGCFFGAVAAFSLGERLGRKKSILVGTSVMSIGAILQIAAYSTGQMIAGRIIAGLGNGLNTATAPVWQAETSQAHWRGKLVVIEMILNIAGFSLSNWYNLAFLNPERMQRLLIFMIRITYGFSYASGPISW